MLNRAEKPLTHTLCLCNGSDALQKAVWRNLSMWLQTVTKKEQAARQWWEKWNSRILMPPLPFSSEIPVFRYTKSSTSSHFLAHLTFHFCFDCTVWQYFNAQCFNIFRTYFCAIISKTSITMNGINFESINWHFFAVLQFLTVLHCAWVEKGQKILPSFLKLAAPSIFCFLSSRSLRLSNRKVSNMRWPLYLWHNQWYPKAKEGKPMDKWWLSDDWLPLPVIFPWEGVVVTRTASKGKKAMRVRY